jgi:hypothetical protein
MFNSGQDSDISWILLSLETQVTNNPDYFLCFSARAS